MNIKKVTVIGAFCAFISSLSAADFYFTNAGNEVWKNVDGMLGTLQWTDAVWSNTASGAVTITSPSSGDDVYISSANIQYNNEGATVFNLAINGDRTISNLYLVKESSSMTRSSVIATKSGGLQTLTVENQIYVSAAGGSSRESIDNFARISFSNSTGNDIAVVCQSLQNSGNYAGISFGGNWNNMAISSLRITGGIGTSSKA